MRSVRDSENPEGAIDCGISGWIDYWTRGKTGGSGAGERDSWSGVQLLTTNSRIKSQESVADEGSGQDYWGTAAQGTSTRAWEGSSKWILKSPTIRTKPIPGESDGDPGPYLLALQPF